MKRMQSGQGMVEYALVLVLVLLCVAILLALIAGGAGKPAIDGSVNEIVDYCGRQAVSTFHSEYMTSTSFNRVTFMKCLQEYEYQVTR